MLSTVLSRSHVSVIAHRGGAKLRPENTLAAFDHAVSLGVDALECDVHLSSDDEVMVIHDATLERTTNATGLVRARTAAELQAVDAGYAFGSDAGFPHRGRAGGVPRLRDLLDRHRDTPLVIEIKGDQPEVAVRTIDVVRAAGAVGRVVLGGFSAAVMEAARRLAPEIPTGASQVEGHSALARSYAWLSPRRAGPAVYQVPFRLRGRQMFGRRFVHAVRRGGWPVHVWVVDDPDDMRLLIRWGVTGLISDRPDVAIATKSTADRPAT